MHRTRCRGRYCQSQRQSVPKAVNEELDARGSRQNRIMRRLIRTTFSYLCWLAFVTIVYRQTPITFFHTETGEWLRIAHSSTAEQRDLLRQFWLPSSHGHYT